MKPKRIDREDKVQTAVERWELEMANLKAEWPQDFTMSETMK